MSIFSSLSLHRDWFGAPLVPPLNFAGKTTGKGFEFSFSRDSPAHIHPASVPLEFFEGLWEYDVAEIFFLEPETKRYLEINLSPNGAWWACWHSGIRERENKQPDFNGVTATSDESCRGWKAQIFLPGTLFTNPSSLRYNVTAILNSPAQTFHSLAKLPTADPDFHQPAHFLPLQFRDPS